MALAMVADMKRGGRCEQLFAIVCGAHFHCDLGGWSTLARAESEVLASIRLQRMLRQQLKGMICLPSPGICLKILLGHLGTWCISSVRVRTQVLSFGG